MAASDSRPIPFRNLAYRLLFTIRDADGDLVTGAATLDSEVSKDCGTFADCTNEATEIATSSGVYFLDLTASEMDADSVAIITKTSTAGAKTAVNVLYPQEPGDIADLIIRRGTAGGIGAGQITLAAETAPGADFFKGDAVFITKATTGANQVRICSTSTNANPPVLTLDENWAVTPTGTIEYIVISGAYGFSLEQMADAFLNRNIAGGADGGRDVTSALRAIRNKVTLAAGTMTVFEEDDSTTAWTATYGTAARDPLSSVDPS